MFPQEESDAVSTQQGQDKQVGESALGSDQPMGSEIPATLAVESENGEQGPNGTPKMPPPEIPGDGFEFDDKPPPTQLSQSAVNHRLRRIMKPRADGSFLVPECVREKWKNLETRGEVMAMFEKAAYEPVP